MSTSGSTPLAVYDDGVGGGDTSPLYKYAFFILGVLSGVSIVIRGVWLKRIRKKKLKSRRSTAFSNFTSSGNANEISEYEPELPQHSPSLVYRMCNFIYPTPSSSIPFIHSRDFIGPLSYEEMNYRRRMREERRYRRMTLEEGYGLPEYRKHIQFGEFTLETGQEEEMNLQHLEEVHVRIGRRGSVSSAAV